MKATSIVFLAFAAVATAQTNLILDVNLTNPATPTTQAIASRIAVVSRAMNQYYRFRQDPVDDTKIISLLDTDTLFGDLPTIDCDVMAFIHPPSRLPKRISLIFDSHTSEWEFLDDHGFLVRYDDRKFSPDQVDYNNKVLSDGTVFEQISPDFTLDQFHDLAFATSVYVKLGYKNYEIPSYQRRKWKLLWTYFELLKASADTSLADLNIGYIPPPLTSEEIEYQNNQNAISAAQAKSATRVQAGAAKALESNQEAAARGDAYGLLRMGERYRDGDGVEKDPTKARDYLQKAAGAGSPTAKEELQRLPIK